MSDQDRDNLKEQLRCAIKRAPHGRYIQKASLFGSYAYGTPTPESDIDLLVEFDPNDYASLFDLVAIKRELEESMGKRVDVLTEPALSRFFRDRVLSRAQPFYERA